MQIQLTNIFVFRFSSALPLIELTETAGGGCPLMAKTIIKKLSELKFFQLFVNVKIPFATYDHEKLNSLTIYF